MNMRNLDNQMMLYFSDKSLIFKLYYYILLKKKKKNKEKTWKLLIIHVKYTHPHSIINNLTATTYTQTNVLKRKAFGREKHPHTHLHSHPQRSYTLKTNQVNGYQLNYILLATSGKESARRKGKPPT